MSLLATQITTRRKAAGLTKAALAERIGVSDVTISYWESGAIKQMGYERLMAVAEVFDCTVSEMILDPALAQFRKDCKISVLEECLAASSSRPLEEVVNEMLVRLKLAS